MAAARPEIENPFLEEIASLGILVDYLRGVYLREPLLKRPDLQQIPAVLNEILAPVFTAEYINKAKGTGSVARFMAGPDSISDRFWDYPGFFKQEAEKENDGEARKILEYLSHGPADFDVKIDPTEAYRGQFGRVLASQLGINAEQIQQISIGVASNGALLHRSYFYLERESFKIAVSFGPIPTNLDKENIEMIFYDPANTDKIAFLTHIGYLSKDAGEAIADKRLGETCDKQDFVTFDLHSLDGKNLTYSLDPDTKAIMEKPDRFADLDHKTAGDLAEIALRCLRINLLHPIDLPPARYEIDQLFPLIESGSIFALRRAIQAVFLRREELPEYVKPLIIRELYVCLTDCPYLAIQFLRDSGLGLLIPGLTDLSFDDWNNILTSQALRLTLDQGDVRSRKPGIGYLEAQIGYYWGSSLTNGADRFVKALEELRLVSHKEGSGWHNLKDLFKRQKETGIRWLRGTEDTASVGTPIAAITLKSGRVLTLCGLPVTSQPERDSILQELADLARIDETLQAREYVEELKKRDLLKEEDGINWTLMTNLVNTMLTFPMGLTAREIALLSGIGINDAFTHALYYFKLTGRVNRQSVMRLGARGKQQRTDIYFLSPVTRENTDLYILLENPTVSNIWREITGHADDITRYIHSFKRVGIGYLEALQSLTEMDFGFRGGIRNIGSDAKDCYKYAADLLKCYKEWLRREES